MKAHGGQRGVLTRVLLLLLLASTFLVVPPRLSASATSYGPVSVALSTVPPTVPADGGVYPSLVVWLKNSSGLPSVALSDIVVYLSSSLPSVATVSSRVTIKAGGSFAVANVTTSTTPGSTEVTAISNGLKAAAVQVVTATPGGFPDHLVAYAVPPVQLARTSSTGEVVVQVQDDLGVPAITDVPVVVSVTSSDTAVAALASNDLVVPGGGTMANVTYSTTLVTGSSTFTASASGFASGFATVQVVQAPPLVLEVTAEPSLIVPNSVGRLVVSLLDQNGDPAEAPNDITVFLTSSDTAALSIKGTVGNAPVTLTIPKNAVYAETTFASLAQNGSATITASAHGVVSGFAQVSVAKPTPGVSGDQLTMYLAPDPVPSDGRSLPAIGIGLVFKNATRTSPAVAPSTFPVVVTASDNATGRVIEKVTVPFNASMSYAVANFNSTLLPSDAVITASAQDYLPVQADMLTLRPDLPIGPPPTGVVVSPVAPVLPADGKTYQGLLVSLEDRSGGPAVAPSNLVVQLALGSTGVFQLASGSDSVTVPANESSVLVDVLTTAEAGAVNVTAGAPGYSSSWTILTTKALSPAKIAMYGSPIPALASANGTEAVLAVQLQDSVGDPAKARGPTTITIASSQPGLLAAPLQVTINASQDYALVHLDGGSPGTATLSAISQGLLPANMTISTYALKVTTSLFASADSTPPSAPDALTVFVSAEGVDIQNATVSWSVSGGALSAMQLHTGPNGEASATWASSQPGIFTYNATVSSPVFGVRTLTGTVVVVKPVSPTKSPVATVEDYLVYAVPAAAAVIAIAFVLRRRRRGGSIEDEDSLGLGPAPGEGTALDLRARL
jgi:hypothetical protein